MALKDFKTKKMYASNKNLVLRKYVLSISILAIIFSSGVIHGQGTNSIKPTLSLKKGESKKYHITSIAKSFTGEGSHEALQSTEKNVVIRILDINSDQIYIAWTYDMVSFINSAPQFDPILDLMNTLNKNMTIKYTVNSNGAITFISNYNEITLKVKQQVESMIQQMSQDTKNASLVEALKLQFEMILSSQELLDALVLEDVYRFHELYGLSFQKGSKNLIPEKDMPDDSYAVEWISSNNNKCKLNGELVSSFSDKKGQKIYEFTLPTYWLEYYSSKWYATIPMNISNSYTISLINSQ